MKICPKCNNQNANTAAVCKSCGASLNEVPDVDSALVEVEEKSKKPVLAFLCGLVSFICGSAKEFLPISSEETTTITPYILYFSAFAVSLLFLVICALLLRGIFKNRPVPAIGMAALLLGIVCLVLIALDIMSFPNTIADFRALL